MKSIIQSEKECFLCGRKTCLEVHHCLSGTANRRLSDEDGLVVWLCCDCHRNLHDHGWHDRDLKELAQRAWERHYGTTEDFIYRYGKNYKQQK